MCYAKAVHRPHGAAGPCWCIANCAQSLALSPCSLLMTFNSHHSRKSNTDAVLYWGNWFYICKFFRLNLNSKRIQMIVLLLLWCHCWWFVAVSVFFPLYWFPLQIRCLTRASSQKLNKLQTGNSANFNEFEEKRAWNYKGISITVTFFPSIFSHTFTRFRADIWHGLYAHPFAANDIDDFLEEMR